MKLKAKQDVISKRRYQYPSDVIERMKVNSEMRLVVKKDYEEAKKAAKNYWFNEV